MMMMEYHPSNHSSSNNAPPTGSTESNSSGGNNIYYSPISAINHEVRRRNAAAAASFHSVVGGGGGGGSSSGSGSGSYNSSGSSGSGTHFNADPWDEMDSSWNPHGSMAHAFSTTSESGTGHRHESSEFCTCRFLTRQRRMSSLGVTKKPLRSLSSVSDQKSSSCVRCGKTIAPANRNRGFSWTRHRTRSNSFSYLNKEILSVQSGNIHQLPDVPQHAQALLLVTPQLRFISAASTDMQGTARGPNLPTNVLVQIIQAAVDRTTGGGSGGGSSGIGSHTTNLGSSDAMNSSNYDILDEYQRTLIRDRSNQLAAAELASLLWVLAHEMSLEDYGVVESQVFTAVFALVHATDPVRRMAGLAAIDALLAAPSADEERKAIKFANTLSNGLRSAHGDFEFLSAVCTAVGHMVTRTANVDFVESEVTRALEWLRTERSDRRYVGVLLKWMYGSLHLAPI